MISDARLHNMACIYTQCTNYAIRFHNTLALR